MKQEWCIASWFDYRRRLLIEYPLFQNECRLHRHIKQKKYQLYRIYTIVLSMSMSTSRCVIIMKVSISSQLLETKTILPNYGGIFTVEFYSHSLICPYVNVPVTRTLEYCTYKDDIDSLNCLWMNSFHLNLDSFPYSRFFITAYRHIWIVAESKNIKQTTFIHNWQGSTRNRNMYVRCNSIWLGNND